MLQLAKLKNSLCQQSPLNKTNPAMELRYIASSGLCFNSITHDQQMTLLQLLGEIRICIFPFGECHSAFVGHCDDKTTCGIHRDLRFVKDWFVARGYMLSANAATRSRLETTSSRN